MIIEQTIEIRADHRLVLDLPLELPLGKAKVAVTVTPELPRDKETKGRMSHREAIEKCRGIIKGVLSSDEFLEMRREDERLEEARYRRMFHLDEAKE
jgi:hypothetical protein